MIEKYTQNRATLHLHGGLTPWISDGTPHQWTTPAGRRPLSIPRASACRTCPICGSSTATVIRYGRPDHAARGRSDQQSRRWSLTFYYNNQQSARLMFYHDHAYGITRLNVYAGEAAGYLLTDQVETGPDQRHQRNPASIPAWCKVLPDVGIPLIIQDKTFVDATTIAAQDPTWNWGTGTLGPDLGIPPTANRRPVGAARLHAGPEPLGPDRRERLRPLAVRPLVLAAHHRHHLTGRSRTNTTTRSQLPSYAPWEPPLQPAIAPPIHGHGSLQGHAAGQRHRLSLPGGGAQGLPLPHPERRQ